MTTHDAAREALEHEVRALCDAGDHGAAATAAIRAYGPELFGFLRAVHIAEADASDVFSDLAVAIWRSIPTFAWQSTLRTWAYSIARNLSRTHRRDVARRARRAPAASDSAVDALAQVVRTTTLAFLRTDKRTRLEALRDALDEEDRMLLVLRIDRKLAWNDLARVLHTDGATVDDASLAREAARLRKRFQVVKDRIRDMAKREGIVD